MTYTASQLIEAFINDFRCLFQEPGLLEIPVDFDGDPRVLARAVQADGRNFIQFSYRFADSEALAIQDALYILIVAGHELSHWLYNHNNHTDERSVDSLVIECWADYFGQSALIATITSGGTLEAMLKEIVQCDRPKYDGAEPNVAYCYGLAILKLYREVFISAAGDDRYPPAEYRCLLLVSATLIAYCRKYAPADMEEMAKVSYFLSLALNEAGVDLSDPYSSDIIDSLDLRAGLIHARLIKEGCTLPQLKPEFERMLKLNPRDEEDLLTNGIGPDPFAGADELDEQWEIVKKFLG